MAIDEALPFGVVLSRYRVAVGLTQEELAERAGLSPQAISALERGIRSRPRAYTVRQLIDALGLTGHDREVFEQAALAAHFQATEDVMPTGDFLGALPATELVARMEDAERMRAILSIVTEGAGHVLLLSGETGVGKTRLLQELMLEASAQGLVVAAGRCYPTEQETSYYPFLDALAGLASRLPVQVRAEGQHAWRRIQELAGGGATGNGAQTGRAVEQQQLFEAVSHLLLLVARSTPFAVLIDDLHWTDGDSLKLLQHLAHTTRHAPILLAGSFCDGQIGEEHPELAQLLQTLSRERLAERITVRRLSLEETTALVAITMGQQEVSEEFASFVYRRTKGIPRLVDQLVRSLGGRLELRGEIGAGAMGRVFRAFDRTTQRNVAAKLVLARSEIALDALLRFQQEGAVLARLDHPHIVDIIDTFAEEHASCIIMELLEGQSLRQILQEGPVPLAKAKAMALQVADALSYAHRQDIVHRDIKPDNVMVLEGDEVKVTDFGIARLLPPNTPLATMATTGMRMGTPLYMAPEQIEGKKVDGRTDIYALGAMLYHMVTGRPPFEGGDVLAIAVKHLQEEPLPPSSISPEVPADWDAAILKAMSKDPARRFQSAGAMEEAIASLSEKAGSAARTGSLAMWLVAAIGLAFAVVAVAAILWAQGATPHSATVSARLNTYLSGLAARGQLSGTVLVANKHGLVLDRGYGYADRGAHIRNGSNTKYTDIAITTNISITELVSRIQAGSLRWSERICAYLPRCPATWRPITIRTLLDGTSLLPDYYWGRPGNTTSQTLAACQSQPLDPPSLGPIEYQVCTNFVLALIVENLDANHPWGADPTFQLAGMHNSGQMTDQIRSPERAVDYLGSAPDPNITYNDNFVAYTTAADEYSFDNALFGGKLLSRAYLNAILAPRLPVEPSSPGIGHQRWGYYWEVGDLFGRRVDFTYAELNRFMSVNMRFPDSDLTVIVLSNSSGTDVRDVAIHAATLALGAPLPPPAARTYVPRALLGT